MKVKSLCSFNRSSGRDGAVKTAIKLKTAPDIVPHHAAKSTIVRGALKNFLKGRDRVKQVAQYFADHYRENVEPLGGGVAGATPVRTVWSFQARLPASWIPVFMP